MYRDLTEAIRHAKNTRRDVFIIVPDGKQVLVYLQHLCGIHPELTWNQLAAQVPGGGTIQVVQGDEAPPEGVFDILYAGISIKSRGISAWGKAAQTVLNNRRNV